VDYLQQIHECIEEAAVCKVMKDNYRECLVEQNLEFNKYRSMKEKSSDLVKVKNQEVAHEKRVKMSEQMHDLVVKEFLYQEELLIKEYARSVHELINAYRNYFLSGAEVLNNLAQELSTKTKLPPAEGHPQRVYNPKAVEQIMSKQFDEQAAKPVISRAEILEKRRVFGIELSVVNTREHAHIPRIMSELITFVESRALTVEGIFRMAASVGGLNTLKKLYDSGKVVDLDKMIAQKEIDIHSPPCLLKLYLRELPNPLLTFDLYDQFLAIANIPDEEEEKRYKELASLLQQLPHHNILLLDRLLQMLVKVANKSDVNLMTSSNLSIVFGLNLLKSMDNNPMRIAKDNASINKICDLLIKSYSGRLNGTFATLTIMAKQQRDVEIRQELEEAKAQNVPDEPEYRSTAPKIISPEHYLPPPSSKSLADASSKKPPPSSPKLPQVPSKNLPPPPIRSQTPSSNTTSGTNVISGTFNPRAHQANKQSYTPQPKTDNSSTPTSADNFFD
jgi:hypothetical protein